MKWKLENQTFIFAILSLHKGRFGTAVGWLYLYIHIGMNLYHGSYMQVSEPRIIAPVRLLDFGTGFYTTTDKEQAIKFTNRFKNFEKNRIVNIYEYNDVDAESLLSILKFTEANTEWLSYVVANRSGTGKDNDYDIVIGPVANDKVYDVVESFELGDYSEEEAIRRLLTFRLTDQIVFKTEKSLPCLKYIGSEQIEG
jgi:hypothetical protein